MLGQFAWILYVVFPALGALLFLSITSDVVYRELAFVQKRQRQREAAELEASADDDDDVVVVNPEHVSDEGPTAA